MNSSPDTYQQIERPKVIGTLAESTAQVKAGEVNDARQAVAKFIAELAARENEGSNPPNTPFSPRCIHRGLNWD